MIWLSNDTRLLTGYHWIASQTADTKRDLPVVPEYLCLLPTQWGDLEGTVLSSYSLTCLDYWNFCSPKFKGAQLAQEKYDWMFGINL